MGTPPRRRRKRRTTVVVERNPVGEFYRHLSWRWTMAWIGGATAILAMVVAWRNAHPILEPWTPATSGYVRQYADGTAEKKFEPVSKWQREYEAFRLEQTLELAKLALVNLEENHRKAKTEQLSAPNSFVLIESVNKLERDIKSTRARIEQYEASLFAKRSER